MGARIDRREEIASALAKFTTGQFTDASRSLFSTLGYESNRRVSISTPKHFRDQLDPQGKLNDRERSAIEQLRSLHLLFQLTGAELATHTDMFDDGGAVQATQIESYLFFAAELPGAQYTRTVLSTLVRAINKPLPMPALVLFRHGDTISLGIIHRRLHKRDQARDVLEKVTLIKDVSLADPIRAHLEILNDFALANLDGDFGVANFVSLHEAWQKRLGSYALSNEFYREIADWYFWAHHQVEEGEIRLPRDCDTEQEQSLFLIRLLTRVIFCWFLVEKKLIPAELFREHRLKKLLKDFGQKGASRPDTAPTYYQAVLQNLFFGTLNMPPDQRGFREKKKDGERYDKNYGITNLWRYESHFHDPADWMAFAKRIPFLNGGLFDCLDEKLGKQEEISILDGFSDNPKLSCDLPNDLFFGPERTVDLSRDYGEEDKRTARSKREKVRGLVEILSRYKFTIEENTPLEEEIALDPELLGKVFENLLASYNEDTRTTARKALGAFYTPREIVNYMVDEALKSYLSAQVPRCKGALEDLFSNKATLRDVASETREALVTAIGRVKILDPACGSGAFPMGALHRLVDLLQKLDPENKAWKRNRMADAERHRAVLAESGGATEDLTAASARIADVERSFDLRFHEHDFARKLYLIENCIYGVDILPIATQIAKLRFFISLIVDQKTNVQADNLGVRPLPNLETRIVAADVLMPIDQERKDLFSADIDKLREELAGIRHEHFNAQSPAAKRRWRIADEAKRSEIAEMLERSHSLTKRTASALAAWDPYDQNSHAMFFDAEWMFGISKPSSLSVVTSRTRPANRDADKTTTSVSEANGSAFDVVIGNPPYGAFLAEGQKDRLKEIYEHLVQRIRNTFLYFLGAGYHLLKDGGVMIYIMPNEFLFQIYMTRARNYFLDHARYLVVVNVGEDVFKAVVPTAIVGLQKGRASTTYEIPVADLRDSNLSDLPEKLNTSRFSKLSVEVVRSTPNQIFTFDARRTELLTRLSNGFKLFESFCDDVANGISTSCDAVYIVATGDARKRHFEREYLKPCIRGGQFRRFWCPEITGDVLLYVTSSFEKARGPNILAYLKQHRDLLVRKSVEKSTGKRDWHLLFRPRYEGLFATPKIIIRQTGDHIVAAMDRDVGYYCIDSVNVAPLKQEHQTAGDFLLGALNSAVVNFYYQETSQEQGRVLAQVKPQRVRALPIPDATSEQQATVSAVVQILSALGGHIDARGAQHARDQLMFAYWERLLNGLMYELYFPREVRAIGSSLFEVLRHARLAEAKTPGEPLSGSIIKSWFEEIYDPDHKVRIGLDKLQTLDLIRIVENNS